MKAVGMLTTLLVAIVGVAKGSIYPVDITFQTPTLELITEGPMYARDSAPLGGDASVISVVLDAIPVNSGGTHTVGVIVTTDASLEQALPAEILDCEDVTTATYQARFYDTPSQILFSHEVAKTGPQFVMIMVCPKSDVKQSAVRLLGTVAFRNPYGYLAASSFPFLPFYGVLLAVYIVTTFLYFSLALAYKRNLTLLHYGTLAVFAFGTLEVLSMFLLYLQLNFSGFPVCCPLRPLAILSVILNAMKRSGSRALLLAVAIGFGVTQDSIRSKQKVCLAALSMAYFVAATIKDFEMDTNALPASIESWLMLPSIALDVVFIVWFYAAITHTKNHLEDTLQTVKLEMYQRLTVAIGIFVALWALMAVLSIAVSKDIVPLPWQWLWVLHSFWHVAYFALLVATGVIWSPSANSHLLAYSFQVTMDEEEADEVDAFFDDEDFQDEGSDPEKGGDTGDVEMTPQEKES